MKPYRRTVSGQDVASGSILPTKGRWAAFPSPGKSFIITASGHPVRASVVAEDCECVPPRHQHRHLSAPALKTHLNFAPGVTLEIAQSGADTYTARNG